MEKHTHTLEKQLIDRPSPKAKGARRMENLLGYVTPGGAMRNLSRKPKKILEQGFILYYKDTGGRETSAVFLPSEENTQQWEVYKSEEQSYRKSGEMPRVRASNLDILRMASGEAAQGIVFPFEPTPKAPSTFL